MQGSDGVRAPREASSLRQWCPFWAIQAAPRLAARLGNGTCAHGYRKACARRPTASDGPKGSAQGAPRKVSFRGLRKTGGKIPGRHDRSKSLKTPPWCTPKGFGGRLWPGCGGRRGGQSSCQPGFPKRKQKKLAGRFSAFASAKALMCADSRRFFAQNTERGAADVLGTTPRENNAPGGAMRDTPGAATFPSRANATGSHPSPDCGPHESGDGSLGHHLPSWTWDRGSPRLWRPEKRRGRLLFPHLSDPRGPTDRTDPSAGLPRGV